MRKSEELSNLNSCLNRAKDAEMVFVLLGRDQVAADTIRFWCQMRVRFKKNTPTDPQILEALACADTMEEEGPWIRR